MVETTARRRSTSTSPPTIEIRPQAGPQEAFLSSSADIAILGGAAGGGKSWALLLEPLRHVTTNRRFTPVIFRRTLADATKPGATWDQMGRVYPMLGAKPRQQPYEYRFPGGGTITIGHLEHETTVQDWQSSEVPLFLFDELTHFSRNQFFYMLSRNRSTCGVRPYIRATTNPDADSWVAGFIAWWIDQETGLAVPERSGVIRWFARISDELRWADSRQELIDLYPGCEPKSVTFVLAMLEHNKILMEADPGYRANLMAMPLVERERLLGGNWKIRPAAGLYFRRSWCTVVDAVPAGTKEVRGWDLAATPKTQSNDPDWTCGTKIGKMPDGRFIVTDHRRAQHGPADVERMLVNTAAEDTKMVSIAIPQDPAQAGKTQVFQLSKILNGYNCRFRSAGGDKITRFGGFSAQAEVGNVLVLRGPWNEDWFTQLEAFPEGVHDDDADSTSEAFNFLVEKRAPMVISDDLLRRSAAPAARRW